MHHFVTGRILTIVALGAFTMGSAAAAANGGALEWVQTFPGTGSFGNTFSNTQGFGAAFDSEGNAYISGSFRRDMPGSYEEAHPASGRNTSVVKVAPSGEIIWARHLHATHIAEISGIAVDSADNVYLAGFLVGELDADPRPESEALIDSASGAHAFAVKLDNNGELVWGGSVGGSGISGASDIAVDADGNVFVSGIFMNSVEFDPGEDAIALDSAGFQDGFLLKWNTNGEFEWVRTVSGQHYIELSGVAVDGEGSVYVTGEIDGTMVFGPGPDAPEVPWADSKAILILKVSPDGDLEWAHTVGGSQSAKGRAIAVSGTGGVRVSGSIFGLPGDDSGGVDFPGAGTLGPGVFVSRLSADGEFLWTRRIASALDAFHGLAVDGAGNTYLAAENVQAIDFLTGDPAHQFDFGPVRNAYLVKYDASGDFDWVRVVQGEGASYGNGVAVSASGEVLFTGSFQLSAQFESGDNPPVFTAQGGGGEDAFMLKFAAPSPHNPYDITGSGQVTAVDVQLVINAALGLDIDYNADVTGNGKVDAVDVQLVINAALGIASE